MKDVMKKIKQVSYNPLVKEDDLTFWGIMQTRIIYGIANGYDITGQTLFYQKEQIGDTVQECYGLLIDLIEENCIELKANFKNNQIFIEGFYPLTTLEEVFNFIDTELRHDNSLKLVNYRLEEQIIPNIIFPTRKECVKYITTNKHLYNKPYPYAIRVGRG